MPASLPYLSRPGVPPASGWRLLALAALLRALPAAALAPAASEELDRCIRNFPEAQQIECLDTVREREERKLAGLLSATGQTLGSLSPAAREPLNAAHQAWTALREADCALVRDYTGEPGKSLKPDVSYAYCMAEHTLNRVVWVDAGVRRTTASALEAGRIRSVRAQALKPATLAPEAATGAAHECRYVSAIDTPPPRRTVALTFDDGPEEGATEAILEVLARHDIRAAFFMIGEKARAHPELVSRVAAAGHLVIGNHSWTHPNFHDISVEVQQSEVARGDALLKDELRPKLFRYPYGNASCATNDYLHAQGYRIVGWHVDSCDWAFDQTGSVNETDARLCEVRPEYLHDYVGHVVSQVAEHQGGIVLMHEIHPRTVRQLEEVIARLKSLGYAFGSIDEPAFEASLR